MGRRAVPDRPHQFLQMRPGRRYEPAAARQAAADRDSVSLHLAGAHPRHAGAGNLQADQEEHIPYPLPVHLRQQPQVLLRFLHDLLRPAAAGGADAGGGDSSAAGRGRAMTQLTAAIVWAVGMVLWYAIRYPHQRRARKLAVVSNRRDLADRLSLWAAGLGLSVFPVVWLATGFPAFADHAFRPWMGWTGALFQLLFLALFFESHRQLGKNWSITLEIRDKHKLV